MKKTYKLLVVLMLAVFACALAACGGAGGAPDAQEDQGGSQQSSAPAEQDAPANVSDATTGIEGNVYTNAEYGFTFTLPEGFSFDDDDQCAMACSNEYGENVAILTIDDTVFSNEDIIDQLESAAGSIGERSDIDASSVEYKVDTIDFIKPDTPYMTVFAKNTDNDLGIQLAQFAYSVEGEGTVFINITGLRDGTLDTLWGAFKPL